MNKILSLLVIGALLVSGCSALGGRAATREVVAQPPAGQPPVVNQPPAVNPPANPPAPASSCLTVQAFVAMWSASTPAQGPGPLIQALNVAFDGSGGTIGTQWPVGPMTVEPMSLVWTDLLANPAPAPYGKWVSLRTQGNWGVFAVYDRLVVPTPGRSARMCESLDPAQHLPGW